MIPILLRLLTTILLILSSTLYANDAADSLIDLFSNTQTISGKFTQTVYDQSGKSLAKSSGNFIIQRPNKFRWDVKTPMQQLTIADGNKIWLYQPDLMQVTVSRMTQKVGQTPLAILSGSSAALQNNFLIRSNGNNGYKLISKVNQSPFKVIMLYFVNNKISQMQLYDNLGQKTQINFSGVTSNESVSNNAFRFRVPKGVDIIRG